jgi:GTP-binding protein LepA
MTDVPVSRIRNFSIIAHIDHGKSTLADRLLQTTGTVGDREMKEQFLDNMDLERERGITIKLQAARMNYTASDGEQYVLNLIDTPGHVDFSYEVSRSLAACEGALLVVDASQGVEAQTLANVYLALEHNLEIIPVLNKIDLPGAEPERVKQEIEEIIGLDCSSAILASAKEGIGVPEILESIVHLVPPPQNTVHQPLRALIFDSYYDLYRGVVVYFRVMDGTVKKGDRVRLMASGKEFEIDELGVLSPTQVQVEQLHAGEVGYLAAAIKAVEDARVGDTITQANAPAAVALPGYVEAKPMVFCGMFPTDAAQFADLREALEKLKLNDAALQYEPETSSAMGFGFRCGFLGLLHMEIVQERLEREYNLDLIITAPSVVYRVTTIKGEVVLIDNPSALPDPQQREKIEEPYVQVDMITPEAYVGTLMELGQNRRGLFKDMKYLTPGRTTLIYELPLAEIVTDFFDQMKSRSRGYASMEYQLIGYRENPLVKLDILINGDPVDSLAAIVHRDKAYYSSASV